MAARPHSVLREPIQCVELKHEKALAPVRRRAPGQPRRSSDMVGWGGPGGTIPGTAVPSGAVPYPDKSKPYGVGNKMEELWKSCGKLRVDRRPSQFRHKNRCAAVSGIVATAHDLKQGLPLGPGMRSSRKVPCQAD